MFNQTRSATISILTLLLTVSNARADNVTVLTSGAFKPALLGLAQPFEASAHVKLNISNDTAGGVAARIARGEDADLVILPPAALDTLAQKGMIVAGSITPVAKSGIGAVVKQGAAAPDITSVEAFKQAVLDAPSVAYIDPAAGGSSGIYLTHLFDKLGIGDAIRPKAVLVQGGLVGPHVANGEAALGFQQISELRASSGVTFVGPLPAEIQSITIYAAGIPTFAKHPDVARALVVYLRSEASAATLTASGLEPP